VRSHRRPLVRESRDRAAQILLRRGYQILERTYRTRSGEMVLIDNFPRSAHTIANTAIEVIAIDKTDLDKNLIMDRDLGYKRLWSFTKTLSKRLRETNERMAKILSMCGGF
jgi:adenylate kinase family enzyme